MKKISLLFVLCASSLYVTAQTQKADKLQVNTTASIGSGAATTATLNVKGADALAASTALSVQNSASTTALRVNNAGQTLLGTATVPTGGTTAKLIVDNGTTNGALQIKDGTQGAGKVLTSDANGIAKWVSIPNYYRRSVASSANHVTFAAGVATAIPGIPDFTVPSKGKYLIFYHAFFQNNSTIGSRSYYATIEKNGVEISNEESYSYVDLYFSSHYSSIVTADVGDILSFKVMLPQANLFIPSSLASKFSIELMFIGE